MVVLLPSQNAAESKAELNAIREAGERILASPVRTRAFLSSLGFTSPVTVKRGGSEKPVGVKRVGKR